MAEALNSNYKGEIIDARTWSGLIEVMAETAKWVRWYNHSRPHSSIGYRAKSTTKQQQTASYRRRSTENQKKNPLQYPELDNMRVSSGA